jgi:hypothetical protein
MSCILCSPKECDRLAARILAHSKKAQHVAELAQWSDFSPPRLAADLYRENHRAFVARYEGRHMDGVESPSTEIRELPEVADAADWEKLETSLAFFAYQCAEGDCCASPVYRFVKIMSGEACVRIAGLRRDLRSKKGLSNAVDTWCIA